MMCTDVQGQVSKVKVTAWKRHLIAESNSHVKISIGSLEIAVCAHARYKFGKKHSRERLVRGRVALSSQLPHVSLFLVTEYPHSLRSPDYPLNLIGNKKVSSCDRFSTNICRRRYEVHDKLIFNSLNINDRWCW